MEFGSPAPLWAFVLAIVCGVLLATGTYVGAAITGGLAVIVLGLWQYARARGDDDSHTIW